MKLTQSSLFSMLCKMFGDKAISSKDSYVLVKGEAPVMLLAHLDTVHREPVQMICKSDDGNIIMSPQGIGGDDRCGVYALLIAYEKSEQKPWLLFTCDEETGGVGANVFCGQFRSGKLPKELSELKMLIEIDRKGGNDAVYYDCANDDFEKYITSKGFKTEFGSFSDISLVAPELGVAAVNLSSGYYNAHTQHEFINRRQLNTTIEKVIEIVAEISASDFPKYEYVTYEYGGKGCRNFWYFDDDYGYSSGEYSHGREAEIESSGLTVEQWNEEYDALLDLYEVGSLETYCQTYGAKAIHELFIEEYGDIFGDDGDDGEDNDEKKKRGGGAICLMRLTESGG